MVFRFQIRYKNAAQDYKLHRIPLQEPARLPLCAGQLPAVPGAVPGLQLPQPQHLHHLLPQDQRVSQTTIISGDKENWKEGANGIRTEMKVQI